MTRGASIYNEEYCRGIVPFYPRSYRGHRLVFVTKTSRKQNLFLSWWKNKNTIPGTSKIIMSSVPTQDRESVSRWTTFICTSIRDGGKHDVVSVVLEVNGGGVVVWQVLWQVLIPHDWVSIGWLLLRVNLLWINKARAIYEYRCNERLKTKTEESTRLSDTGLVVELEHLKTKTRLIDKKFARSFSVKARIL